MTEDGKDEASVDVSTSADEVPRITIMGPSQSGKTLMISTLLNFQSLVEDVIENDEELDRLSFVRHEDGNRDDFDKIDRAFKGILRAEQPESTIDAYQIAFDMLTRAKKQQGSTLGRLRQTLLRRRSDMTGYDPTRFVLRDGPGGALSEATPDQEHKTYLEWLHQSEGIIVCLPVQEQDFIDEHFNRLEHELQRLLKTKPPLRYIAVSLTKFDTLFPDVGARAFQMATDPYVAIERVKRIKKGPFSDVFSVLRGLEGVPVAYGDEEIEVKLFPVSTYGFVAGRGSANYYRVPAQSEDLPEKSGLMTRIVSKRELDADARLRDHYPEPIIDAMARRLWRPFNLVAPFYYAATGQAATPHCFTLDDLD
ncbi:MAG: hypothetical protein AAGK02_01095 [Pseudomonadota bacterium]